MRILVTGGAGFIGSHLVDALAARGHKVRVLDNLEEQVHGGKQPAYLNREAEYFWGDVQDREMLRKTLQGVEAVFHEAACVGVGQSMYQIEKYLSHNVLGTAVLLDVIVNDRIPLAKLVVASSMSIYGEGAYRCATCGPVHPSLRPERQLREKRWEMTCPRCAEARGDASSSVSRCAEARGDASSSVSRCAEARGDASSSVSRCGKEVAPVPTPEEKPLAPTSVYAVSKRDQEEICLCVGRSYGIPTVALRYFNVYGPRQALSNPYTGVCAIFSSRIKNGKPPLIFEDGRQSRDFVHVSDVVQANLLALENRKADFQALNVGTGRPTSILEIARTLAKQYGQKIEPELAQKFRAGDIRHCVADISKIQALGFKPGVALEEGLRELTEWGQEEEALDRVEKASGELEERGLTRG